MATSADMGFVTSSIEVLLSNDYVYWTLQHMALSVSAIVVIALSGVLFGVYISQRPRLATYSLIVINFIYTIPSIAILGLLLPFTGIGNTTAMIAIVLYGVLPVVRNTHAAMNDIEPQLIESARGMGSTEWQILLRVKLPLSVPMIVAGIRTMAVMTVALTAIAAFVGAGGLGVPIWRGISTYNMDMVVIGSILVAILSITVDQVVGFIGGRISYTRHYR